MSHIHLSAWQQAFLALVAPQWLKVVAAGSVKPRKSPPSIDWFKGKITGTSHVSWENLWFTVDFPASQPIDRMISLGPAWRRVMRMMRGESGDVDANSELISSKLILVTNSCFGTSNQ